MVMDECKLERLLVSKLVLLQEAVWLALSLLLEKLLSKPALLLLSKLVLLHEIPEMLLSKLLKELLVWVELESRL